MERLRGAYRSIVSSSRDIRIPGCQWVGSSNGAVSAGWAGYKDALSGAIVPWPAALTIIDAVATSEFVELPIQASCWSGCAEGAIPSGGADVASHQVCGLGLLSATDTVEAFIAHVRGSDNCHIFAIAVVPWGALGATLGISQSCGRTEGSLWARLGVLGCKWTIKTHGADDGVGGSLRDTVVT